MPTILQRSDRFGIALTVLIALVMWVMHGLGGFRPIDDWVVDRWQRLSTPPSGEKILLVSTPESAWQDPTGLELNQLTAKLRGLGAKSIAIAHATPNDDGDAIANATHGAVCRATESDPDSFGPNSWSQPIHRRFAWASDTTTFEQRVASSAVATLAPGTDVSPPPNAKIRFAARLPRVTASRVIDDELVPEMVKGRTVIIGKANRSDGRIFHVPTAIDGGFDELELRGQIVRCLTADDWIGRAASPLAAVLFLLSSLLSVQAFRNLNATWWPLYCVVAIAWAITLSFLSLAWFSLEIPCVGMVVTIMTAQFWVTRQRFDVLRSALDRRYNEANANAIRVDTHSVQREEPSDVWKQAADAWYDLFAPTRVAMLELDAGDTYLVVRAMAGADSSDIGERRRDVTRMPYRDAVDQKTATKLSEELFFTATAAAESLSAAYEGDRTQFAVPLIAGKTIGVVAIEIESDRLVGWDAFAEQAMEFASELATHLANYREHLHPSIVRGSSFSRAASLPEQWMAASIVESNSAAKSADELWMRAFESSINPIAICDPFGRVVQANSAMITALQHSGQSLNEFDAIEWLQDVTNRSRQDCSNLLRRIVLQQRGEKLFCKSIDGGGLAPILIIRPLARDGEDQGGLSTRAMSLELVSPSLFTNASTWERRYSTHQRDEIRRRAARCLDVSLEHSHRLDTEPSDERGPGVDTEPSDWEDILNEIGDLVSLCSDDEGSLSDSPDHSAPLPMDEVLRDAVDDCRNIAEAKGIGMSVERDRNLPRGQVNPYYLSDLFKALTECVTSDAVAGETVSLSISHVNQWIIFDLYPMGMDPRHFHGDATAHSGNEHESQNDGEHVGSGTGSLPAAVADEVHRAYHHVNSWGGSLRIVCSDDFRISVRLSIRADQSESDESDGSDGEALDTASTLGGTASTLEDKVDDGGVKR